MNTYTYREITGVAVARLVLLCLPLACACHAASGAAPAFEPAPTAGPDLPATAVRAVESLRQGGEGAVPQDLLAALADFDGGSQVPFPEHALDDTEAFARALLAPAAFDGLGPWVAFRPSTDRGIARAPIGGSIRWAGRSAVRVLGVAARTTWALALAVALDSETPIPGFERTGPAAVLGWADAASDSGRSELRELAGGVLWTRAPWTKADGALNDWVHGYPPVAVSSWSDGSAWVMVATITHPCYISASGPDTWDFMALKDPRGPPGIQAFVMRSNDDHGLTPLLGATEVPSALREQLRRATDAMRHPDLGMSDAPGTIDWDTARRQPVPNVVCNYLPVTRGTECLTVSSADAAPGAWLSGLLEPGPARSPTTGMIEGPMLWRLAGTRLSVTVVPDREYPANGPSHRGLHALPTLAMIALPRLFGEYGRYLCLTPMRETLVEDGDALLLKPDPATEVGLLERVKVGDTPWGRCRIYVDPAILHIVFDLPKED